jgi:hypothetical protein
MSERQTGDYVRRDLARVPVYAWVLALVVLLLAAVACGLWAYYALRLGRPLPGSSPTPIIWTATPEPTPTPAPTGTEAPAPTPTISPDIVVGGYVQVSGTEGIGVSLREEPDVASNRVAIGYEGDVLVVVDGPRQLGGYTWWLLQLPDDEALSGWAVGNYLEPVESP